MTPTIDYLGFNFFDGGLDGIRAALRETVGRDRYQYVVTPNVDHVVTYYRGNDRALVQAYDGASLQICDSRILALIARTAGRGLTPCPGSDITRSLLDHPIGTGVRIGVIGPDPEDFRKLQALYPNAPLTLIESGDRLTVGTPLWNETVRRAREAEWDILLVCLSFPKQEFFARDLGRTGRTAGVALCVGASIDFLTGRQKRAPRVMQRAGLEWLYRLASNPRRMADRYLIRGPAIFSIAAASLVLPRSVPQRRTDAGPRVLFVSKTLPHDRSNVSETRAMEFVRVLKRFAADLTVVGGTQWPLSNLPAGFRAPASKRFSGAKSALRRLVRRELRARHTDRVVVDGFAVARSLPAISEDVPVTLIAEDGIRECLDDGFRLEDGAIAERAQEIWTSSESDAEALRRLFRGAVVRNFSVPTGAYPRGPACDKPMTDIERQRRHFEAAVAETLRRASPGLALPPATGTPFPQAVSAPLGAEAATASPPTE